MKERRVDLIAQAFAARMMAEIRFHVEQRAGFILECVIADMFPGESVELYGRKVNSDARLDRTNRVIEALDSGATASDVARKTGVPARTVRHIRQVRGRIGGKPSP